MFFNIKEIQNIGQNQLKIKKCYFMEIRLMTIGG